METMAHVTELRLGGGRGSWGGATPSSCPEVDLEVIEEYLQEHSLEVQPAYMHASPLSNVVQYVHSHHSTRIIENNWSGQHAYEWHCGAPTKEYEEQAPPPAWPCSHQNQWDHVAYSDQAIVCIDSDSQSSCSQYHEYHDAPSPTSNGGGRPDKDPLLLAPFSGKRKERLFQFLFEMLQTPSMRSCIWWVQSSSGTFQFSSQNKECLAEMWGRRKGNRKTMTYRFDEKTLRGLQGDANKV